MASRRRRRQWGQDPEEPFAAGLDDREEVSLALYGLPATLHPIDHVTDEDEAAELLPWPEGAAEPVLIDRFDARLILDPLELAPSRRSAAAAARESQELEEELEFERWRDLWALQRRQQRGSASPSAASLEDDEGRDAAGCGYKEADVRLQGLEPPPPPPVGLLDADSGAVLLEPGALAAAVEGQLPFTGTQLAVIQRTAEFVRRCSEPGAALLREAAAEDPTFAFLSPDHIWHDFFQALVENKASMLEDKPAQAAPAEPAAVEGGSGSGSGNDDGGLGSLLGDYMSDDDDAGENNDAEMDAVTQALIERLVAAAASGGSKLAVLARERLAGDPAMRFLDPESSQNAAFRAALEKAGLSEETIAAWTGAPAAPLAEPAGPSGETLPAGVVVQAAPITFAAGPAGGQGAAGGAGAAVAAPPQWLIEKMRAAAGVSGPLNNELESEKAKEASATLAAQAAAAAEVERAAAAAATEAKKVERRRKVREMLEQQRRLEEERRQGQAAARQQAEEERQRHLAAISQHKKMFLDDD